MQELLNRSDDHLWAFVSNGLRLRMLRDNVSLSRQAYVEFDLEAMMEGELYSDFVLLWLLCHQSRVEGERPEECWLEKWSQEAQQQGVRALDGLRKGVERAISALGSGFLKQAGNQELLEKLRDGAPRQAGLLPPAAAHGLPPALPVHGGGPRPAARPGRVRGGGADATSASTPRSACATWPSAAAARATPTSSRACAW